MVSLAQEKLDIATCALQGKSPVAARQAAKEAFSLFRLNGGASCGTTKALHLLVRAHLALNEIQAADEVVAPLEATASGSAEPWTRVEPLLAAAEVLAAKGQLEDAITQAAQARDVFLSLGDVLAAAAMLLQSRIYATKEDTMGDAMDTAREAQELAAEKGDLQMEAAAWCAILGLSSDVKQVEKAAGSAVELFRQAGDRTGEAGARHAEAERHKICGRMECSALAALDAQKLFKEVGCTRGEVAAVGTLLQAKIAGEHLVEALQIAKSTLADISATGDKSALAAAFQALAFTYNALLDGLKCAEAASSAFELYKELGDKKGQATALYSLAEARLQQGVVKQAFKDASRALRMFEDAMDMHGVKICNRMLTEIHTDHGLVDKAPSRHEALHILSELVNAVELKDADAFDRACRKLEVNGKGVTQQEIVDAMEPLLERDRAGTLNFLRTQTSLPELELGKTQHRAKHIIREQFYWDYKVYAAIGYGPKFRIQHGAYCATSGDRLQGMCVQQMGSQEDRWERYCKFPASHLDGGFQAMFAMNYAGL